MRKIWTKIPQELMKKKTLGKGSEEVADKK